MFWITIALLWAQSAAQQQVQRGEALFLDASHGCVNCHQLKGHGTAIGPDIKDICHTSPHAIATAIRATLTEYVQTVQLKSGESFPGMPAGKTETTLRFYDVSKWPPESREIPKDDLKQLVNQDAWKHPPAIGNYTSQQIADIVAYLRYAVTGDARPVGIDDIE